MSPIFEERRELNICSSGTLVRRYTIEIFKRPDCRFHQCLQYNPETKWHCRMSRPWVFYTARYLCPMLIVNSLSQQHGTENKPVLIPKDGCSSITHTTWWGTKADFWKWPWLQFKLITALKCQIGESNEVDEGYKLDGVETRQGHHNTAKKGYSFIMPRTEIREESRTPVPWYDIKRC